MMKIHSTVAAGLLGAAALMTSGCGTEDVNAFVNEALRTAYITVANGQAVQDFNIANDGATSVGEYHTDFFVVTMQDNYTVSHTASALDPVTFAKEGGHLYGLCASPNAVTNANVVADSNDGKRLKLVNLGIQDIPAITITLTVDTNGDGTGDENRSATASAAVCSAYHIAAFDTVDPTAVTALWVGTEEVPIPTYDPDLQTVIDQLGASAEFDLVVFDLASRIGTIVPIVPPVE